MGSIWVNPDGLRVQFGTRKTGDEANFGEALNPSTITKTLSIYIQGSDFTSNVYTGPRFTLPTGAIVRNVSAEVKTVFALGGTTPTINVGVLTTEATNRMAQLTQAQAQATGVYSLTASAAGTLAAGTPLATQSTINIALGGTSPTVTSAGYAVVYVTYEDPNVVT